MGERSSSWTEDLVVRRVMAGCISKCHYLGKAIFNRDGTRWTRRN
ncbi:hypothetical protein PDR5_14690 [Pseudomonas sp. DR 5-09]|nr:hypothetical protein PDR5_14690 [Pseudomonas sp. DR 5-09]